MRFLSEIFIAAQKYRAAKQQWVRTVMYLSTRKEEGKIARRPTECVDKQ